MAQINIGLSKSLYTRGLQCEKSLWLKKYKPAVLTPPDEQLQAVFETGNLVGDKACELFPEGKEVPYEGKNHAKNIELTQKLLSEGVKNIYEATFEYDGILVLIDVFHQKEDGSFEIYEVKSSTWHSNKSIDDINHYIHDVSIQYYVLNSLRYNISDT